MEQSLSIKKFQRIVRFLTEPYQGNLPLSGVSIADQFKPGESDDASAARNLIASFIILMSDSSIAVSNEARRYIEDLKRSHWAAACEFMHEGISLVFKEIGERYERNDRFREDLDRLYERIMASDMRLTPREAAEAVWRVFFPEGVMSGDAALKITCLREKRSIRISSLNDDPVHSPEREVLFTANALVTMPYSPDNLRRMDPIARHALEKCAGEEQLYWYDHPIPIGAAPEANELLYCLDNFSEALRFEESAGSKDPLRNIDCVLSVSVTHRGLHGIVRDWLQHELAGAGKIRGINLYAVTEDDAGRLLEDIILPAARRFMGDCAEPGLRRVFGVDGEYGRHYSFLKAIALFWHVCISPEIKATFKIDLDQVFPQQELISKTGTSAFGHLRTPLWGTRGTDADGEAVYLGMIAGALVNRKDIGFSLHAPDVVFPEREPQGDEALFWSAIPQALSTMAEMMTQYGPGLMHDGSTSCVQRVHVTGGTTGILVDALKRYRPFTPSCFGRAEDQAYLLSVLFKPDERGYLRYAHEPGLIMRHDADLFDDAAEAGRTGKTLGDYVRVMLFSDYAGALPWRLGRIKDAVDPFTGCFISGIPITIAYLRFALKASHLFATHDPDMALRFFNEGIRRLSGMMELHGQEKNPLSEIYEAEKQGWDLYYDVMDILEEKISSGDPFALELAERARKLIESFKVTFTPT